MTGILLTIVLFALAGYALWSYYITPALKSGIKKDNNAVYIIITASFAFILRLILAGMYKGHETDMTCFISWSNAIFEHGLSEFYTLDMFHDYPPGYMYVLYAVGALQKLFGFSDSLQYILIKLPAIACDIITGIFIYKLAKKKFSDGLSTIFAALYLFNPAVITNSSLWGQVDSVYTLFVLLMIYFIAEKKMIISYFIFAICIFIKPQSLIFTPVLIGGIVENVFLNGFDSKVFLKNLGFGICAIIMMFLLAMPFGSFPLGGVTNVFEQYKATIASYPHLTVNAMNLWGALGKNWDDLSTLTSVIGYLFILSITIYSLYLFFKSKSKAKYYFTGAILAFLTYMLSTKMHDRYAFPSMILMLMSFIYAANVKNYLSYVLLTLSQFFNTAWVLFVYEQDTGKYFKSPVFVVASIVNLLIMAYILYLSKKEYIDNKFTIPVNPLPNKTKKSSGVTKMNTKKSFTMNLSNKLPKITRFDLIAMAVITVIYSCIALYDLGDMHAPETEYMVSDAPVTMDLGQDYNIQSYKFFLGSYQLDDNRNLTVTFKDSTNNTTYTETLTDGSVFHWEEKDVSATARYITLSTNGTELSMKEFAVLDSNNNVITPVSATPQDGSTIFDEQQEVPERSTFRNGTYFDEIYHGRTAYEFIHGLDVYEWTHPPLGKVFISLGILIFGMCPFGWRIAGTVFGIIMVPIIYMFAKKLCRKSWLAIVTCLLFTFDFMHFAQTRIATIDVYVTFFIMLMYYFMYKYYNTSFYDTPLKKTFVPLALCGISMGLGIASKWTGVYAGIGLAVLFFITLYKRYAEYLNAKKYPNDETNGISHKYIIESFAPNTVKTIIWCCIFFIVIPVLIYGLSYIPYLQSPSADGIKTILENQESMLTYHSKTVLNSTHPYSSRWYEWIIMKRPIWYYSGTVSNGIKEGISSFGNPLVWWLGIPAFIYMVYRIFKNKDKNALFLVIAYLAQLVSWIPVTRLTFIYHYFPCVPFIVLMLGYSIYTIYQNAADDGSERLLTVKSLFTNVKLGSKKSVIIGAFIYAALVIILFAMFYPVLSGHPCSTDYAEHFLKWFDSWVLL